MSTGITPSEKFVTELCQRAFLKLWTHPNPIGKDGKELCDCLIVCGPHIIIVSVKEIQYKETGDKVGWDRWHRDAIDASARQIWGAERWLARADQIKRRDGRVITLPPKEKRKIHRIAVSLGAAGQTPIRWGDLGHGFVQVCDEFSLGAMFGHLDSIVDFINYLLAVEAFVTSGVMPVFSGGGSEDLLAMYVRFGDRFGLPEDVDPKKAMVAIEGGLWKALTASQEYRDLIADRKNSYIWDKLIENFADCLLKDEMFDMYSKEITRNEEALIAMAMQPRNYRGPLAQAFIGLLESKETKDGKLAARATAGANNTGFVFLTGKHSDRETRSQELMMRCHVARGRLPVTTVVGIATDKPGEGQGHSSDILYLFMPEWSAENEEMAQKIVSELGYFKNTKWN
ncbi:MAG TPA: hypothetical protein VED01_15315 [Burkholderiales bacterium]|nr:hypothetical protein [Burkholderiales bacterium]